MAIGALRPGGDQVWRYSAYAGWLRDIACEAPGRIDRAASPTLSLISAHKP